MKLLNGEVIEETIDADVVTIGRSRKCTIQLPHEGISRKHIQLEIDNGKIFVTDTNSTNGVYIDNVKIEANKRTSYETYLLLSFGAVQSLQIELDSKVTFPLKNVETKSSIKIRNNNQSSGTHRDLLSKKKQAQGEVNKTKFWLLNILIFVILLIIAYWYTTSDLKKVDYSHLEDDEIESATTEEINY